MHGASNCIYLKTLQDCIEYAYAFDLPQTNYK